MLIGTRHREASVLRLLRAVFVLARLLLLLLLLLLLVMVSGRRVGVTRGSGHHGAEGAALRRRVALLVKAQGADVSADSIMENDIPMKLNVL